MRRVPLAALGARLVAEDGRALAVELEDVSAIGLRARGARAFAVGTRCRIELGAGAGSIEARGTVVRAEGRRMGLRIDMLPYESFERLRALLLEHAEDPAALGAELDERLGFLGEDAA